ncbi:MAG: hypothetical protein ACTSPI_16855 [Candidatus Heimdallarchaeaceae archaeon]
MHNQLGIEELNKVDEVLDKLDKEIAELPNKQVWTCKNRDEINMLIDRMNKFIDSCYMSMSGTEDKTRKMLNEMIDMAEEEKKEAENVLFSLGR